MGLRLQQKDLNITYAHDCPYNMKIAVGNQRLGIACRNMATEPPIGTAHSSITYN